MPLQASSWLRLFLLGAHAHQLALAARSRRRHAWVLPVFIQLSLMWPEYLAALRSDGTHHCEVQLGDARAAAVAVDACWAGGLMREMTAEALSALSGASCKGDGASARSLGLAGSVSWRQLGRMMQAGAAAELFAEMICWMGYGHEDGMGPSECAKPMSLGPSGWWAPQAGGRRAGGVGRVRAERVGAQPPGGVEFYIGKLHFDFGYLSNIIMSNLRCFLLLN